MSDYFYSLDMNVQRACYGNESVCGGTSTYNCEFAIDSLRTQIAAEENQ